MPIRASLDAAMVSIRSIYLLESRIADASSVIQKALLAGHKLLTCGNGGSASDAAHLATEFACRFVTDRRPYPALCLAAEAGLLTATANDYSFSQIFARQIEAFGGTGDVLVALSTSGNSENIHVALQTARKKGLFTIALLGRDGGVCQGLADIQLIPAGSETARIQEAHKIIIHLICELVEPALQSAT